MIGLIDGDLLVYSVGYNCEVKDIHTGKAQKAMALDAATAQLQQKIDSIADQFDNNIIFLSDDTTFRHRLGKILPYKGRRDKASRPLYYQEFRDYMMSKGAVVIKDHEADDGLAMHARMLAAQEPVICSLDKDLDQIPGMHYNWNKDIWYNITRLEGAKHFYMQVVQGDRSDNIPSLFHSVTANGGVHAANKLKRSAYIKRFKEELETAKSELEVFNLTKRFYLAEGGTVDYFDEVCHLLYLKRSADDSYTPPTMTVEA